jgi:hypothetical protein
LDTGHRVCFVWNTSSYVPLTPISLLAGFIGFSVGLVIAFFLHCQNQRFPNLIEYLDICYHAAEPRWGLVYKWDVCLNSHGDYNTLYLLPRENPEYVSVEHYIQFIQHDPDF